MVELLVVIAVLAVLGGIAVPATHGLIGKARVQSTRKEMSDLAQAIREYAGDRGFEPHRPKVGGFPPASAGTGAYPTILGREIESDVESIGWNPFLERGWNGPYLIGDEVTVDADGDGVAESVRTYQIDAWERFYVYRNRYQKRGSAPPWREVELVSGGPDRNPATRKDNLTLMVYAGPAF